MTDDRATRTIALAGSRVRHDPRTATWESPSRAVSRGWRHKGEGSGRVTENERRAADSLRASDLVLRGIGVIGLIAAALVLLLVLNPT